MSYHPVWWLSAQNSQVSQKSLATKMGRKAVFYMFYHLKQWISSLFPKTQQALETMAYTWDHFWGVPSLVARCWASPQRRGEELAGDAHVVPEPSKDLSSTTQIRRKTQWDVWEFGMFNMYDYGSIWNHWYIYDHAHKHTQRQIDRERGLHKYKRKTIYWNIRGISWGCHEENSSINDPPVGIKYWTYP